MVDRATIIGASSLKPDMYKCKGDLQIVNDSTIQEDDGDFGSNEVACCAICLQDLEDGDEICWSHNPECFHAFHSKCIESWLIQKDECPCCRKNYMMPPLDVVPNKDFCCNVTSSSDDETEDTSSIDSNEVSEDDSFEALAYPSNVRVEMEALQ